MNLYEQQAMKEMLQWKKSMSKHPSYFDRFSKKMQVKLNSFIPDKIHSALTMAIKQMVRAVLFGAGFTSTSRKIQDDLQSTEILVSNRISAYRKTAAAEGGITGAGGFLFGLADFPLLLGIKMKLLYDIAALYGYDVDDYRERLFILYIFQLAFSSQQHRKKIFSDVDHWNEYVQTIPKNLEEFDWRSFQQEYRDYIDLAKMLQLVPGIGAVVGVVVNYKLIKKLGETAINAYRLRWHNSHLLQH
jgi:hypothetical protein